MELKTISASISDGSHATRAVAPTYIHVGRHAFYPTNAPECTCGSKTGFVKNDVISVTSIERYQYESEYGLTAPADFTMNNSGSWDRPAGADKIYWADPSTPHVITAYSLPQGFNSVNSATDYNKWKQKDNVYYSALGDPTNTAATDVITFTNNADIIKEDVVTCFKQHVTPNINTLLFFRHALSSVKVAIDIDGFSKNAALDDAEATVTNVIIKQMPTMYKWNQGKELQGNDADPEKDKYAERTGSYGATALESADDTNVKALFGSTVSYNQKKDVKLWEAGKDGNTKYIFYGLAVPRTITTEEEKIVIQFTLNYNDPLGGAEQIHKTFMTELNPISFTSLGKKIEFKDGYCTQINIDVNHGLSNMTIGVKYIGWEASDDESLSVLQKKSPYLDTVKLDSVTKAGEANKEFSTWLYIDTEDENKVKDVDRNDGSADHPYTITTARQLLSFAKEVNSGRSFENQYVLLDANICMQPEITKTTINWIGIGSGENVFNGTFICKSNGITKLQGAPFFTSLGANAVVEGLGITTTSTGVTGDGVLASTNAGKIIACRVNGTVTKSGSLVGGIVGTNSGTIVACSHEGTVDGTGVPAAGIAVTNTGSIIACYHAGEITGSTISGVSDESTGSYYDKKVLKLTTVTDYTACGKTTSELQQKAMVDALNTTIDGAATELGFNHTKHGFTQIAGAYPLAY